MNITEYNSDEDYNSDEYDSDDDNNNIYEPEEKSVTKYNISLCELYNKRIHGDETSNVLYHYLVYCRFKKFNIKYINNLVENIQNYYNNLHNNQKHDIYINYSNIIHNLNYIKPEITECIYLNSQHCIAIKKTIWLKLIQRTWKKVFKQRQIIFKKRCEVRCLKHIELTGKWPDDCFYYPGLRGMLNKLRV